jgi:hypothetical protein
MPAPARFPPVQMRRAKESRTATPQGASLEPSATPLSDSGTREQPLEHVVIDRFDEVMVEARLS